MGVKFQMLKVPLASDVCVALLSSDYVNALNRSTELSLCYNPHTENFNGVCAVKMLTTCQNHVR